MSSAVDASTFDDILRSRRFNIGNRCIFFDTEFQNLFKIYQDLSDVMTSIKKRIERKDIQEISSSKFAYYNFQKNLNLAPENIYNFSCGEDFCRVIRVRKQFFVYCSWIPLDDPRVYRSTPCVCGAYSDVHSAISVYNDLIYEYYQRLNDVLF